MFDEWYDRCYNMLIDHVLCLDCVLRWIALRTNKLKC